MSKRRNTRQSARRRSAVARRQSSDSLYRRSLRYEPLEDRRLLAVVTVDTLADTVDFNDGHTSLREAIFATNTVPGADTINFAPALTASGPATILLTLGELKITDSVTIDGPGSDLLTIDASGNDPTPGKKDGKGSRIFNIDDGTSSQFAVSLSGLTLTGGDMGGMGGAILSQENLSVASCTISGNYATFGGGGIYTRSELTIDHSTITGNTVTQGGGAVYSNPLPTSPASLTITDTAITNNSTAIGEGGGVRKRYGDLTIERSNISNNTASTAGAGMSIADGTFSVLIADSEVTGNSFLNSSSLQYGGGIFVTNGAITVTIERSQISGNRARTGGGIDVKFIGLVTIDSSTISNNSAQTGGGIASERYLVINNSTIANNVADLSTAIDVGIQATILYSTITGNLSGPRNMGNAIGGGRNSVSEVYSSIIVGNANGDVPGLPQYFKSDGYNLVGTGGGSPAFNQPGDQVGVTNPLLGPLADNGGVLLPDGSHILTQALLPGSPAINAGDLSAVAGVNGVPQFDERGTPFGRVFNGRIDVGAFEYQQPSDLNLVVDTLADEADGNYSHGHLSLREAIQLANTYPSVDTIRFDPALTASGPATILLTLGELKITDSVTIVGPGSGLLTIDASGSDPTPTVTKGDGSRIFNIDDGNSSSQFDVSIGGLTLTGSDANGYGGAILSQENLTLTGVSLVKNAASTGSALAAFNGDVVISDSNVTQNASGSATVYTKNANVTIENTAVTGNTASSRHITGIEATNGELDVLSSVLSGNTGGSAVSAYSVTLDIDNSTISGNSIGVYAKDSQSSITDTTITNNIVGSSFANGVAAGIGVRNGTLSVLRSTLAGNVGTSYLQAGGLGSIQAHVSIDASSIFSNSAENGAAIYCRTGQVTITGSTIDQNTINGNGLLSRGVVRSVGTVLTVAESTITGNMGSYCLSANALSVGNVSIESTSITGNSSGAYLFANGGVATITNSVVTNNSGWNIRINGTNHGSVVIADTQVSDGHGFGVFSSMDATSATMITGCQISNNSTGGVYSARSGSLAIDNTVISNNSAPNFLPVEGGGGIASRFSVVTISDCEITGNSSQGNGGGITAQGPLNIVRTQISGNTASWDGGGIWDSAPIVLTDCTVKGNTANNAGGIKGSANNTTTITRCTIAGNSALANSSGGGGGGGVLSGTSQILDSTIAGNTATSGGGVYISIGTGDIERSTISDNVAGVGGGVYGTVTIVDSTICSNTADVGGGIYTQSANISFSTVALNTSNGTGSGIFLDANSLNLDHVIIAANFGTGGNLTGLLGTTINSRYSLIGSNVGNGLAEAPVGSPDTNGNLIGGPMHGTINPLLGPLADNGGPTLTLVLLPGSPAINAGDPAAIAGVNGVPSNDQRGAPFTRVYGGRIDIGAVEFQPNPLPGDYNFDGVVDGADYVVWRATLGSKTDLRADGNADGVVNNDDYAVWRANLGKTLVLATEASVEPVATAAAGASTGGDADASAGLVAASTSESAAAAVWSPAALAINSKPFASKMQRAQAANTGDVASLGLVAWLDSIEGNRATSGPSLYEQSVQRAWDCDVATDGANDATLAEAFASLSPGGAL